MKTLLALVPLVLTTACAHPMYGARPTGAHPGMMAVPAPPPSPVGRWDNVMMLEPGTPLRVLRMDGTRADGRFHSASPVVLRLESAGAPLEIAMADVVRVDRSSHFGDEAKRETVRGAAVGLGTVGVLGLISGRTPPARHWAAGAIVGGYGAAQSAMWSAGPGTIYVVASPPPAAR